MCAALNVCTLVCLCRLGGQVYDVLNECERLKKMHVVNFASFLCVVCIYEREREMVGEVSSL